MALTVKTLYDGQLGTTAKAILYTVPAGKAAIVKNIRLVNTDSSARTANVYYLRATLSNTSARQVLPAAVSIAPGSLLIEDNELTMAAGDQVLGDGSVASKIDCVISGIERDA